MSAYSFPMFIVALLSVLQGGYSQDCTPPTAADLENVLKTIIGGANSTAVPVVTDFQTVCRAYSKQKDLLRAVSVVVEYKCSGHENCPEGMVLEQIESECVNERWSSSVLGNNEGIRSTTTEASLTTPTRENCSLCLSPELANQMITTTIDVVTHCVGILYD